MGHGGSRIIFIQICIFNIIGVRLGIAIISDPERVRSCLYHTIN